MTVAAHWQPTSDLSNSQPAIQSKVTADENDDAELVIAEPDFPVLNLPSTLRLPSMDRTSSSLTGSTAIFVREASTRMPATCSAAFADAGMEESEE